MALWVRPGNQFMRQQVRLCDQFMALWVWPDAPFMTVWVKRDDQTDIICESGWSLYDTKTRRLIYDCMNQTKHPFITPSISIYWTHLWDQVYYLRQHEWDQLLKIWQNEWYQTFHILIPYQAIRTITKIAIVTRHWMHGPFTTLWVRSGDAFMALWIIPYAQFMTPWVIPVYTLMRPWVRPDIPFITSWVKPDSLFIETMSRTKLNIWDTIRETRCFIQCHQGWDKVIKLWQY